MRNVPVARIKIH